MQDVQRIGERIRQRRQQLKLTAKQLGGLLDVTQVAVSKWETGKVREFPEERIAAIAEVLGTTSEELLYGAGQVTEGDKAAAERTEIEYVAFKITEGRAAKRWTQAELARQMGVDPAVITRLENEERKPTNHQIFQLEKLLEIELRPETWIVLPAYLLAKRIPDSPPEGFREFIQSEEFAALNLPPLYIALLAGMAGHPQYWTPKNEREWVDLAEALVKDFEEIEFRVVPAVDLDLLRQLDER